MKILLGIQAFRDLPDPQSPVTFTRVPGSALPGVLEHYSQQVIQAVRGFISNLDLVQLTLIKGESFDRESI